MLVFEPSGLSMNGKPHVDHRFHPVGLLAGFVARVVVPGDDSMGIIAMILLGMVGSLVSGFRAGNLLFSNGLDISAAGIIGSIIGATIVLIAYNQRDVLK